MAIRLKDVAERAGVSIRTVSNVVNDFRHVAPATREHVQRAIDELGYRPNHAARQLRGGRTGLVALVVPELDSPYFSRIGALLTDEAERRGWTLLVEQTRGDPDSELRLLRSDRARHVDGIVFSPWGVDPGTLDPAEQRLPMVVLGERSPAGGFDHVSIDNVAAARSATEHLLDGGRRHIAAIGAQPQLANATAAQRITGYRSALDDADLAIDDALLADVRTLHRHDGAEAFRRLYAHSPEIDAAFCFTDELALGAVRAAYELGLRVPEDVAVVGFDDIDGGRFSVPSLTTIAPDKPAIARLAADLLDERLRGDATTGRTEVAPHALVVRESSGAG